MRKEYSFEIVDRCETLYVVEGKTHEEISKESGVSVAQIQRWSEKYEWRKKKEERKHETLKAHAEVRSPVREKILLDLKKQKERYDKYFEGLNEGTVDNQAQYAYNQLCKTISDIQRELDSKPDLYRMAPPVMDEFVRFVKKTVKEQSSQELVFGLIDRFFDEVKSDGV
jgi:transposase-like protein